MSGAVAQTKVGRARRSARAANGEKTRQYRGNPNRPRRARSDAPYLSERRASCQPRSEPWGEIRRRQKPRQGRQNSDPREFSFAANAAPISNTETETHG